MQETDKQNHKSGLNDQVDLLELAKILFNGKWIIITITAMASIFGVIYSLSLPDIYQSKAIMTPSNNSNSNISRSMQNYAGLAGLAGISIPSGADNALSSQAIQKLNTLSFFENNILPNIFLPDLVALESFDLNTNTLIYDQSIYIKESNKWVRNLSYPGTQAPSAQESFENFRGHLQISEDKKTGFITLKVKHLSPFIAKEWADLLVSEVNNFYRQKDKSESQRAISFLNKQITSTNLSEIKEAISQLLQEETKKLTFIEANKSYVFEYIDPPAVMEKKSEPVRSTICILVALFGFMASIFLVFLRHYFQRK
ncbi:Wzz/FepE/Etk N-terminal domain-containing protein [Gammaproteobacteria bacterium]|nr:Wzz/FepE/Etk N-terminal domain-containing protein [Gammaproteobacteria bacterium]